MSQPNPSENLKFDFRALPPGFTPNQARIRGSHALMHLFGLDVPPEKNFGPEGDDSGDLGNPWNKLDVPLSQNYVGDPRRSRGRAPSMWVV